MSRLKNFWGLAAVIATLVVIYSQLPLGTALEFSSDEGFEVMKSFLCNQGHVLYKEIWNNMPPVFTFVLADAFKVFGTSILTARLVNAGFGIILFAVFHDLIRRRSGPWCALLATFFLLSSPMVPLLSVAAMLEVPTMATGLLAAWLLFQWKNQPRWAWLLCSGAVLGLAIQTKPTAILLVPAMVLEFALLTDGGRIKSLWAGGTIQNILLWGAGVVTLFVLIGLTWGRGSLEQSWKSHAVANFVPGFGSAEDYRFKFSLLQNHVEGVLAAAAGIGLALARRRGREIIVPMTLLLTDASVHAIHRPWWDYYYLHLAIPLAWMAGWAVNELVQDILQLHAKYRFRFSSPAAWKQWVLCLLVAMVVTRSELRLEWMIKDLRQRPSADADPIVQKMKEYAKSTHLVYCDSALYAFHAKLPMPPELAVVTLKRFWSGQLTTHDIVEICQRNRVEQVLLTSKKTDDDWKRLLSDYDVAYQESNRVLYVTKQFTLK